MMDTRELEEELQKEDVYFQYDDISTWRVGTEIPVTVAQFDIETQQPNVDLKQVSKAYMPAYKRRFGIRLYELQQLHSSKNSTNVSSSQDISTFFTCSEKRGSIYEQILPVLETPEPIVKLLQDTRSPEDDIRIGNSNCDKESILFDRLLAKQDFGSFYPSH
ncbi:hypothetical protein C6P45_004783 [Maudiozyma exigua]|uniref:Uncharacterized protein n=1 Tax=Maudiozyma exigua TaxID=34358 RepID=A0A9P6WE87_MAUEX|nr:hypothetical protein C6P45_004783 [Kazachstania exigua]